MYGDEPWEIDTNLGIVHMLLFFFFFATLMKSDTVAIYPSAPAGLLSPAQARFQKLLKCKG